VPTQASPEFVEAQGPETSAPRLLMLAVLPLVCAGVISLMMGPIAQWQGVGSERSILVVAVFLLGLVVASLVGCLILRRLRPQPGELAAVLLAAIAVVLVGIYLYWVRSLLDFRADFLLWSESDFVNDILKIRVGHPIFSAPANLESFHYPPATQLLTYGIARLSGHATSIPLYRVVQLGFAIMAGLIGVLCVRRILQLGSGAGRVRARVVWVWAPVLLLAATNQQTNPYVHLLHDDALALLISAVAYWLLLEYAISRQIRYLAVMALLPAAGFYVKQSLAIWALLYCLYLIAFDRPRSIRRAALFGLVTFGVLGAGVGLGQLIWGPDFQYWIFTVLGHHPVSPLRSFQHLLDTWTYLAAGLVGGCILLARAPDTRLLGLWVVGLGLFAVEIYTSGVAWMLNHIGPGCLLLVCWLLAGLTAAWSALPQWTERLSTPIRWVVTGSLAASATLFASGMAFVRLPRPGLPPDAERYTSAIEREFGNGSPERTLLDMGTWVYLASGTVMKDRSASAGEAGFSGTADFSGMLGRIRTKRYEKILVRDLNSPQFLYDYGLWPRSSGVRQALLENYVEVRRIPKVVGDPDDPPWFRDISVLVPRQ
jgi:hypothetical protein